MLPAYASERFRHCAAARDRSRYRFSELHNHTPCHPSSPQTLPPLHPLFVANKPAQNSPLYRKHVPAISDDFQTFSFPRFPAAFGLSPPKPTPSVSEQSRTSGKAWKAHTRKEIKERLQRSIPQPLCPQVLRVSHGTFLTLG